MKFNKQIMRITQLTFIFILLLCLQNLQAQKAIISSSNWNLTNKQNQDNWTLIYTQFEDNTCLTNLFNDTEVFHTLSCSGNTAQLASSNGGVYDMYLNLKEGFNINLVLQNTTNTLVLTTPNRIQEENIPAPKKAKVAQAIQKPNVPEPKAYNPPKAKKNVAKEEDTPLNIAPPTSAEEEIEEIEETMEEAIAEPYTSRKVVYQPQVEKTCYKDYGVIFFDVVLGPTGRPITSKINIEKSTNPTSCLVSLAVSILKETKWNPSSTKLAEEEVEVSFNFEKPSKKKKK